MGLLKRRIIEAMEPKEEEPMGYMKDLLIRIRSGSDESIIEALDELLPRWISVTERLPEPDYMGNAVGVLACLPDGERCIAFCDNDEYGVRWNCNSTQKPTHWMPLPEPPEVK
jgi:hypothetical protein